MDFHGVYETFLLRLTRDTYLCTYFEDILIYMSAVIQGTFRTFDGTKIYFQSEGDGKVPLVFCYGLICSNLHWKYQFQALKEKYRCIWFDYRGHHRSEMPEDPESLNLQAMAADIDSLCDELKLKRVVTLGHSMGVNVVLEHYRRSPDRVMAMVLANGTARNPLDTLMGTNGFKPVFDILRTIYALNPNLVKKVWSLQKHNILSNLLIAFGGFNPFLAKKEDISTYISQIYSMDPQLLLKISKSYQELDSTPWLHEVRVPTLVLCGENDKVIPPDQQHCLAQLIPGSELDVIQHGSHCPQLDLPDLVTARLEKFLERHFT